MPEMKQSARRINWEEDDADTVLRKIRASDGNPGANATINGSTYKLYGSNPAFLNPQFFQNSDPGDILAKSGDSVCLRTSDDKGVWVSHMKNAQKDSSSIHLNFPPPWSFQKRFWESQICQMTWNKATRMFVLKSKGIWDC
mmetsp:Transcript_32722/g.31948  ORF Transcript_32722/g.31948 Transcript_32722/m.31948 type:complete len:141 (+) Transcript_32722:141-563(+)